MWNVPFGADSEDAPWNETETNEDMNNEMKK
jgi:hypothetical protein